MGRLLRGEWPKAQGEGRLSACRFMPAASLSPLIFGLLFLTGCSGLNQAVGSDPLLGGPPLRPAAAAAAPPQTPVPALPPPAANSTLSTAALAAGAPRPADNGRDLRIGSPRPSAGNDGWASEGSTGTSPQAGMGQMANGTGVLLRPPEPATEPGPRRELAAVSNPGSSRATPPTLPSPPAGGEGRVRGVTTFEQAKDQIAARGALWQRLETVGENGDWKYSCSIPNRQNPRIRRTYEAKASDPLAATRAVLEHLDKEQ